MAFAFALKNVAISFLFLFDKWFSHVRLKEVVDRNIRTIHGQTIRENLLYSLVNGLFYGLHKILSLISISAPTLRSIDT